MNSNPTTRRRAPPQAPPPPSFAGFNDRAYRSNESTNNGTAASADISHSPVRVTVKQLDNNDDGGQGKARRKRSSFSLFIRRVRNNLRLYDVLLLMAAAAKLASVAYNRHKTPTNTMMHQQYDTTAASSTRGKLHRHISTSSTSSPSSSMQQNQQQHPWISTWKSLKMPFHTPILYRHPPHHTNYIGMFRYKQVSDGRIQHLNDHGYATVDDVIYHADDYRAWTDWAIHESHPVPQYYKRDERIETMMKQRPPSIVFSNDIVSTNRETNQHIIEKITKQNRKNNNQQIMNQYIDDNSEWDAYYARDDDYLRGSKGTGLHEKLDQEEIENSSCMRPTWYLNYYPTCNVVHETMSGETWMVGDDSLLRHWEYSTRSMMMHHRNGNGDGIPLSKYLGHGYYRDAFLLNRLFVQTRHQSTSSSYNNNNYNNNDDSIHSSPIEFDEVVFKSMRSLSDKSYVGTSEDDSIMADGWAYDPTDKYAYQDLLEDMRKDALVMELLSSSRRAADIYAFCALSSAVEFTPVDIEDYIMPSKGAHPTLLRRYSGQELHDIPEYPVNGDIPPYEKLTIALEMAKCIAEMHGYVHGPIANVDVQAGQFFRGRDGLIKLVDFNRAEPLLYDIKQNKYCKFVNGMPAEGMFRAPEENIDAPLNEKVDIYSLGNVLYSVLTGIMVYVDRGSDEAHKRIVDGKTEPIADLYYEEPSLAALAEAIELCWTYDIEERPTIFEIVEFLEKAVIANSKHR